MMIMTLMISTINAWVAAPNIIYGGLAVLGNYDYEDDNDGDEYEDDEDDDDDDQHAANGDQDNGDVRAGESQDNQV